MKVVLRWPLLLPDDLGFQRLVLPMEFLQVRLKAHNDLLGCRTSSMGPNHVFCRAQTILNL